MAEAKRAVHELAQVEERLQHEDKLRRLYHETQCAEERERETGLRFRVLHRRRLRAKLKAETRGYDLAYRRIEEPPQKALDSWEQYLRAWLGSVTGGENFQSQTEEWLEDYGRRRRAQVAESDPRREEKLATIGSVVEELRVRRDRMMRELWDR